MIYLIYYPFIIIVFLIYCLIVEWIYKKFIKRRVVSKIKRFFIIFGMVALYFSEAIVAHIIAYYYVYTLPLPSDLDYKFIKADTHSSDDLKAFKSGNWNDGADMIYGDIFENDYFVISDNLYIDKNGKIIRLKREVERKFHYFVPMSEELESGYAVMIEKYLISKNKV